MESLDNIQVNFNPAVLSVLNVVLGIVMFGVALDMRLADFMRIAVAGKAAAIGLCAQFFILPALTYMLVSIFNPPPAIALGMILVAACPGGNMSNFLTHHARGDTALSVTMTGASTVAALIMTPFNLAFWGGLYQPTSQLLRQISLDPMDMVITVFLILGLPIALGMTLAARYPDFTAKLRKPMQIFSLLAFGLMVLVAVVGNFKAFMPYLGGVAFFVAIHNGGGLLLGYSLAALFKLNESDRRAISLEVGMQNAGLGLILVFNHFDGNGGMALIAAWWGIWHLISGFTLSSWWRRRDPRAEQKAQA